MKKRSKKYQKAREALGAPQVLAPQEGLRKVKALAYARFDESVDVHINLGIDPEQGNQVVRGSVTLPHGIGKKPRILVFAKGDQELEAQKAGADYVGAEDLIQKIEAGWTDFDFAITTPDLMTMVSKVARILGPRGLLPNKKNGTVTEDVGEAVTELQRGRLFFKNDKSGLVHLRIGRRSFEEQHLLENFRAFMRALLAAKPAASRGVFIKQITVSSTMGVGVKINAHDI